MEHIYIKDDYITLGQLLKYENLVESGGMIKYFLSEVNIYVNNEPENRRGKKLYPNDVIEIEGIDKYLIVKE